MILKFIHWEVWYVTGEFPYRVWPSGKNIIIIYFFSEIFFIDNHDCFFG